MSASTSLPTPEQRLRFFLIINAAAVWPVAIVLGVVNETRIHSSNLAGNVVLLVGLAIALSLGAWAIGRIAVGTVVAALTVATWLVIILLAYSTPELETLMVLVCLVPLVMNFRFVTGRMLWLMLTGTVLAGFVVTIITSTRLQLFDRTEAGTVATWSVILIVPVMLAVIATGLLQVVVDLRAHARDLRESRSRILTAADTARRDLERDLHDGAQQRLVAMQVHLSLVRSLIKRGQGEQADAMLADLSTQIDAAIAELRALAQGIYPPLLAERGLVSAVTAAARRSPIPVTVRAGDVGRYPQPVEAAAYFCILESLQNAAKHSEATAITLEITPDPLRFAVTDDGIGFDSRRARDSDGLMGLEARARSAGGRLHITSAPGHGTTVAGIFGAGQEEQRR